MTTRMAWTSDVEGLILDRKKLILVLAIEGFTR
jgi:hypothetical protein